MWITTSKLTQIDNAWLVEFNVNDISREGIPDYTKQQNTCNAFTSRKEAVEYMTSFLHSIDPEQLEKEEQMFASIDDPPL